MNIVRVRNLGKIYKSGVTFEAISKLNLTVEKGEFLGIMGPSGSGKTTLLNMLSTIDPPTSGEVLINGKNPYELTQDELSEFRRRELGFVFQSFNLLPTLTVQENIMLPLVLDGVPPKRMKIKTEEIAEKLGTTDILHKATYEISGGQAQRTAIARALINDPQLILADEPTGNLDSKAARDVMETLEKRNREDQITTLLVTHDPVAASYCNRVIFIKDGKFFNEITLGENREQFYQRIVQVIAMLGGRVPNELL